MSLPTQPPRYPSWGALLAPIKEGEAGWRVYALQRAIGADADGDFGPGTRGAVELWQASRDLEPDGVVGPKTQTAMLRAAERTVHRSFPRLPDGTLTGFAVKEGAGVLAATNWYTPPGGRPGVDCGPVQWRLTGPPFDPVLLRKAFNPRTAFRFAARLMLGRIADYHRRNPGLSPGTVERCAVLAHNAPFLAEQVVRNGRLSTPDATAVWTTKPGGGHYTHGEWFWVYPNGIMQYVDGWKGR